MATEQAILTIDQIKEQALSCRKCPELVKSRNLVCFSYGTGSSGVMIIGEAPSQVGGNITGKPMSDNCSATGYMIQDILDNNKLVQEDCYMTNIVFCSPSKNRSPSEYEISNCFSYTLEEIRIVKPKIIFLLGSVASRCFFRDCNYKKDKLYSVSKAGWLGVDAFIVPMYHPSYILRFGKEVQTKYKAQVKHILEYIETKEAQMNLFGKEG